MPWRDPDAAAMLERLDQAELAGLLDEVYGFVTRYVVVGVHEAAAIALWVAHAWALDAFEASGYLEIRSPVRRCGKTTLLNVLALLVPRPWTTVEPSEAVFYRRIASVRPTILLDEVDAIFAKKSEATEGLRACLNAGNQRGWTVPRCQPPRMDIVEFEIFCAKALSGIGNLPGTVTDRSIPIEMRRKGSDDEVERFRTRKARELAAPLAELLARWSENATAAVELELVRIEHLANEGQPLASLDDRAWEQAWEPLIAVASLAGQKWLQRAIAAAAALSGNRDDELDEGVNLLADIRGVFGERAERETLATYELLEALLALEESPWRDWWSDPRTEDVKPSKAAPRKLARTLRPFGIRPATVKLPSGTTAKGYHINGFRDAWARYLAHDTSAKGASPASPPSQPSSHAGSTVTHEKRVSVTSDDDPAHPSPDVAQPSRFDAGDGGYGSLEGKDDAPAPRAACPQHPNANLWQSRDQVWHCYGCEPWQWRSEVIDEWPRR